MPTASDLTKQKRDAERMKAEADRAAAQQREVLRRHGAEIDSQIAALQQQKARNSAELSRLP
jgi:hypothetical protein